MNRRNRRDMASQSMADLPQSQIPTMQKSNAHFLWGISWLLLIGGWLSVLLIQL